MKQRPWHRWYEEGVPTSLDVEEKVVTEYLRDSAQTYPANTAVVFENRRLTYRQLEAQVNSFANALADMGLWPGPRDPGSEREIQVVRRRWARIQRRAKRERQR